MTLSVTAHCWHCHQHHMMPMTLSMAPLYSLHQDNQNKEQQDFLVNEMLLDPIFMLMQVKQQQETAIFIYHAITMYVPTTNMALTCHIYAAYTNYFICAYKATMSVYIPHMNSMQTIMRPKALVNIHFNITDISSMNKYSPHTACICPTALLL